MRGRARRGRFTLDGAPGGLFPKAPDFWERAHAALAERLLAPDRPGAELYDFVHGEDAELIAAYDRTARTASVRTRLRTQPAYAADCFTGCSRRRRIRHPASAGNASITPGRPGSPPRSERY
ncbi:GTPase-associated protein 1-related protein [Streptomyces anulatus]|uniref:GTPase-associated protein 1-related protein n=1 Tax=Streptomyces anulatus TaxID=1892 RepID=UPI0036927407